MNDSREDKERQAWEVLDLLDHRGRTIDEGERGFQIRESEWAVIRPLIRSALSSCPALTDAEIVAAWNGAGADRPEAGASDLYLHYMRAIAKAQRDKMALPECAARTPRKDR